ncbi:radical SAM protein [Microbispora sp. NPDC046933]|uniref:radical SAM protein n=1 Tax=Microbispora sp. NPDC046933 TaxID=3155618 RepID=UPI003407C78C
MVKVSKFCNLRCRYCYEFPSLGDTTRMSLDDIRAMFGTVGEYFRDHPRRLDFVWHGGEPLLMGADFYWRLLQYEHEIFDPLGLPFTNAVQTNLTIVRPDIIRVLKEVFDEVGVSVDLFGGNRVDRFGGDVQPKVLHGMQALLDEGIHFGCISVLSKATAPYVENIYTFFEDLRLSFRFLPIYRTGYAGQLAPHELSPAETVDALKVATDRWFASAVPIRVEPVETYVSNVLSHLSGRGRRYYDKEHGEAVFIVDTDGGVYSNGDAYDGSLRHGNIFHDSFSDMRRSAGFARALAQSRARVRDACTGCRYFGSCSGFFMGEATPEQRWRDGDGRLFCGVALPVQHYIEERLRTAGLLTAEGQVDLAELRQRAGDTERSVGHR